MADVVLQFWEFKDAPDNFKCRVPEGYCGGWLAFICALDAEDIVETLVNYSHLVGLSVIRCEAENGVVLAGPYLKTSG